MEMLMLQQHEVLQLLIGIQWTAEKTAYVIFQNVCVCLYMELCK